MKLLDANFIPAFLDVYENKDIVKEKIDLRKTTIIKILELFQSENFEDLVNIQADLKNYSPIKKPKKKSIFKKIRENIILTKIILSIVGSIIIILSGIFIS